MSKQTIRFSKPNPKRNPLKRRRSLTPTVRMTSRLLTVGVAEGQTLEAPVNEAPAVRVVKDANLTDADRMMAQVDRD